MFVPKISNYLTIGLGALLLIFLLGIGIQQYRIVKIKNEVIALSGELENTKMKLDICTSVNTRMAQSIMRQNEKVSELEQLLARKEQAMKTVMQDIEKSKAQVKERIKVIYEAPPVSTKDEAFDQLVTFMKQESAKW